MHLNRPYCILSKCARRFLNHIFMFRSPHGAAVLYKGAILVYCILNIQFREVGSRTVLLSYLTVRGRSRTASFVVLVPET